MRVVLISPYGGIANFGLRYLAAYLKRKNHQVKLIFLPRRLGCRGDFDETSSSYNEQILTDICHFCENAHLVGISVMTNYFFKAAELTKFLKGKVKALVVWGGIHPTVEPEECLEYADAVCLGEGEKAILELVEKLKIGRNWQKTANFWFKNGNKVIKNSVRPLIQNLDELPFPDYELNNHYILDKDRIIRLNKKLLEQYLPHITTKEGLRLTAYPIFITRGCPHACSYCCNNALRRLYRGQKYIRRRRVKNIMEELEAVIRKFPFIKSIRIEDDSFLVASNTEIIKFAKAYKKKINLPFICLSSPVNITEEKIKWLVAAGLIGIQMGIQSGSDVLNKNIFNRPITAKKVLASAKIINKYQDKLVPPRYDIITDNPFEKEKDLIKTIKLLAKIPGKYILNFYSLVFYPGTAIFKKAVARGLIKSKKEAYFKDWLRIKMSYLKFLIFVNRFSFFKLPQSWLKFFLKKQVIKQGKKFNFVFEFFYRLVYVVRLKCAYFF